MGYSRREFVKSGVLAGSASIKLPSYFRNLQNNNQEDDRLVLLGTQGGPVIRSYRSTPSANLIVYKNIPFVIDTGYGVTLKLIEAGVSLPSLRYIFITHHHSDHNLELGPLLYNSWVAGLSKSIQAYAPIGLKFLLDSYWQSNLFDIETRIADEERPDIRKLVNPHEYEEGEILSDSGVVVSALRNIHPPIKESYALKFKLGDKIIVFSGDTAYCPALAEFAFGADYLIHEIMYPPAIEELVKRRPNAKRLKASILSHHTAAEDVGRIASEGKVKNLILNHFVPSDDKTLTEKTWTEPVRSSFKGNIIMGKDLLQIAL
jgi:ribonuclease BN (tRNA processing enzyme)